MVLSWPCVCGLTAVSEQISISPFISPCFLGVEIPGGDAATPLPFTAFLRENEIWSVFTSVCRSPPLSARQVESEPADKLHSPALFASRMHMQAYIHTCARNTHTWKCHQMFNGLDEALPLKWLQLLWIKICQLWFGVANHWSVGYEMRSSAVLKILYRERADCVSGCWSKKCLCSLEWSHNSNRQLLFVLFIYQFHWGLKQWWLMFNLIEQPICFSVDSLDRNTNLRRFSDRM